MYCVWIEVGWGETCLATGKVHYYSQIQMGQTQNLKSKSFKYQWERIRHEHSVLNPPLWLWSQVKSKIRRGLFTTPVWTQSSSVFIRLCSKKTVSICHCYAWSQAWILTLIFPQSQTLNGTPDWYRFEANCLILPETMSHKNVFLNNIFMCVRV